MGGMQCTRRNYNIMTASGYRSPRINTVVEEMYMFAALVTKTIRSKLNTVKMMFGHTWPLGYGPKQLDKKSNIFINESTVQKHISDRSAKFETKTDS